MARKLAGSAPLLLRVAISVLLAALLYVAATFVQVVWASGQDHRQSADAIIVLGAAQYDGEPSGALAGRLDHAYELWAERLAPYVVVTGGNQPGDRFTEGLTGYAYLRSKGVPEDALLVEVQARDTYEALSASKVIFEERGLGRAILVSDPYHNLRLQGIADELDLRAEVSATSAGLRYREIVRETIAVSVGRLIGYRRLANR